MYSGLDPSQREAVCCGPGPCEVIAGPGSGKTLVLTERILYLLDHFKLKPSQILVLTFSRAAAEEMRGRFLQKAGEKNRSVRFGTFHSVFFHILKESTGREYTILGQKQKEQLLSHLICNYYPDENERPSAEEIEKMIRKEAGPCPEDGEAYLIRRDYRSFLSENGYLDFDDMITLCRRLLLGNPEVLSYWQRMFRAVLVDEFQDINREQYEILKLLSDGKGLFVVGDDDQSIYGFRGSTPAIMQQFMEDYQDACRIFLNRNYRCSGSVCSAAALMIGQNRMRIPKEIRAARPACEKMVLKGFRDDSDELRYLYNILHEMTEEELCRSAVIVRTNTHVLKISSYLSRRGVPCLGNAAPSREVLSAIIRDLEAYCMLADGLKAGGIPRSALLRVMNRPDRYLLRSVAGEENLSPQQLLLKNRGNPHTVKILAEFLRDLDILGTLQPEGFVRYLTGSMGYGNWALTRLGERQIVELALEEVIRESEGVRDIDGLIDRLRRLPEQHSASKGKGIRIMTMHMCKGLEFDSVFLPALNEGIIPGRRCRENADFEEERRLLYVAMTRARNHLELLYVTGSRDNPRPPSRFLSVYGVRNFVSS